ncbi:unnamed protein product [Brassica oleracea var. botrytis]|uniref:(rape) hypothetical protein n=1 Tax=Brassica napus TaxID=3708 RepID=A0A816UXN1_BRANA|nr:unnamed protein product [Brassica napus]
MMLPVSQAPSICTGGASSSHHKKFENSLSTEEEDLVPAMGEHYKKIPPDLLYLRPPQHHGSTSLSVPLSLSLCFELIAYIDFKEGAEKAYDLNGTEFGGWNILVDEAKPRDSSGGGFSGGGGGHFSGGGGRFGGGGSSGGGRGRDNGGGRGFSKPSYIPSGTLVC